MDILLLVLGVILIVTGIAGCFLPFLPGPPLSFAALLLLQASKYGDFATKTLVIVGIITVIVVIIDYFIPIWGTKKFGGSRSGVIGATIGLIAGIFLSPIGIILGPFIGAVIGELMAGRNSTEALRSGVGSLIGFLFGTVLKLTITAIITFYFFNEAIHNL